jgi:uncharacterized phiE125 gp8 family phage protein
MAMLGLRVGVVAMVLKIYSPPSIEPVSLQEEKEHIRGLSGAFSDNFVPVQSIAPGSHAITTGYALLGTYADVLGYQAMVSLDAGAVGAGGTVDVKIQESDDHVTWTDWTGGAFAQITAANDNAVYRIAYTGAKEYIRPAAKVLLATCEFGVQIVKYSGDATEDAILTEAIKTARLEVDAQSWRQLITATWDAYLDSWPAKNFIPLPLGQLQSVTSLAYTDSAGTVTTMTPTTDYLVDTVREPGRIVLPYGVSWPCFTPYPVNPIAIRFVCGYGATAASVPSNFRTAIKMRAADLYSERGERYMGVNTVQESLVWKSLAQQDGLWGF